jgi:tetratricopeptide (TPR) repeat protein
VYLKMDQFDKADENLTRAERILSGTGDKITLIDVYSCLAEAKQGIATKTENTPDSDALAYADKAMQYAEELKLKQNIATCHYVYAKLYTAVDDFKTAEKHFENAIRLFKEMKTRRMLADAYVDYARMIERDDSKDVFAKKTCDEYCTEARTIYKELDVPIKV